MLCGAIQNCPVGLLNGANSGRPMAMANGNGHWTPNRDQGLWGATRLPDGAPHGSPVNHQKESLEHATWLPCGAPLGCLLAHPTAALWRFSHGCLVAPTRLPCGYALGCFLAHHTAVWRATQGCLLAHPETALWRPTRLRYDQTLPLCGALWRPTWTPSGAPRGCAVTLRKAALWRPTKLPCGPP